MKPVSVRRDLLELLRTCFSASPVTAGSNSQSESLWRLATRHSLEGALARAFRMDGATGNRMPECQASARLLAIRTLRFCAGLKPVLAALDAQGIRSAVIKGPVLSKLAYGDACVRWFDDIDILIPAAQQSGALRVLSGLGYQPQYHDGVLISFRQRQSGMVLDLHSSLFSPRFSAGLDHDAGFWSRLRTVEIPGATVETLSGEDTLLHLCIHESKHRWERLEGLLCLAELIHRERDLDWSAIRKRAQSTGCERMLLLGIRLARDVLSQAPPPRLAGLLDSAALTALANEVALRINTEMNWQNADESFYTFHIRMRERLRDRLRYFTRSSCNKRDTSMISMPPGLEFLYVPIRCYRLVRDYGFTSLRHVARQVISS